MNIERIKDKGKFIEDLHRRLSGLCDDLLDDKGSYYVDRTRFECGKMIESIIKWMDDYKEKE